jgi:hypothetical protein
MVLLCHHTRLCNSAHEQSDILRDSSVAGNPIAKPQIRAGEAPRYKSIRNLVNSSAMPIELCLPPKTWPKHSLPSFDRIQDFVIPISTIHFVPQTDYVSHKFSFLSTFCLLIRLPPTSSASHKRTQETVLSTNNNHLSHACSVCPPSTRTSRLC